MRKYLDKSLNTCVVINLTDLPSATEASRNEK